MKIIGWNYPIGGGLKDMIEKSGLHPITSLNSLSVHDKKTLLEKNIVLCKSLTNDVELLRAIGLTDANIDSVLEEIALIDQPY